MSKRDRDKRVNGYMTVEASLLMPMVILLYLLIVMGGFFLYDRCVMSQDFYLLAFRGSSFTYGAENYGEVIYHDMEINTLDRQYVAKRLEDKSGFYPFLKKEKQSVEIIGEKIVVSGSGFNGALLIRKSAEERNPLTYVKEKRRKKYA